jgi:prepilin-type N-terminal cleavage/methylation domain-containing protein
MRRFLIRPGWVGFTLVELLVVLAIFGVLIGLLLPAVQAAREASRLATCKSNLKQLGLAMHLFHDAHRRFPSGGWGYQWPGFSDAGGGFFGQPGSWTYTLLPYIEQEPLYQLGRYESPAGGRELELRRRLTTPIGLYHCPSRRSPETFAVAFPTRDLPVGITGSLERTSRIDYAANVGDGDLDRAQAHY